ncbi:MAG TPA: hypothetical protein PKW29_11775 [Clostridia bacterium]|nr:hypothetical protein [Clostridia bacterium]
MKRFLSVLLTIAFVASMTACAAKSTAPPESEPTPESIVEFTDPLLEELVRKAMNKPDGDIAIAEAEAVTELELGIDWQQEPAPNSQIKDISGLENFKNLENLNLHFHAIEDISPLSGLTKLRSLSLGGNPVADIAPLSNLTGLGSLTLFNCQAQDYTPLSKLSGLGMLLLDYSTISDVSMLSGLTELWWLGLANTQVSDVSPLSTLANLRQLQLAGCPITDYSPLAEIYPNLEEKDFEIPSKLMDIFGDEFNPYGMDSPATVFEASFEKGSDKLEGKARFLLSMTGSGNMYACVAYQADAAGLSEDEKNERINEYLEGGFCQIRGTDGRIVDIKRAIPEDDRYEYVEADGQHGQNGAGCVIDVTYFIDDVDIEKYTQLVRDNYSVDALMPIADFFDTNTDFAECGITVNVYKDEARAYAVYHLPDVISVQQIMQVNGDAKWWEWDGMMQTAFMYDNIESKLTFDTEGGAITVEQRQTEISAQPAAEGSLDALGFGFDDAGMCGVFEDREPHYKSVAIARPEWGEFNEDWNIEFFDTDIKGYSLRITYHAEDGRYHISVDKDGESCAYDCYPEKDQYGWEYPDIETVHRMFGDAFDSQGKELYYPALAHFEQYVQEHFGMSVDELYAAPKQ